MANTFKKMAWPMAMALALSLALRPAFAAVAAPPRDPGGGKKIMAMGDSITFGYSGNPDYPPGAFGLRFGGYRGLLQNELYKSGCGFDFVGRNTFYGQLLGDVEHEGWPGYTLEDLKIAAASAIPQFQPDVVLFMGGTNNIYWLDDAGALAASLRLSETIETILTLKPDVSLYVAQISPVNNTVYPNNRAERYNSLIPGIVAGYAARGYAIHLVDQFSGLASAVGPAQEKWYDFFEDGEHPLEPGFGYLARAWRDAILANGDCARPAAFEVARLPIKPDLAAAGKMLSECVMNAGYALGQAGYDPFVRNKTNYGTTFRLNNILYPKGLGQEAFSRQCFDVSPTCNIFHAEVGLDDVSSGGVTSFRVFVDDTLQFASPDMNHESGTLAVNVALPPAGSLLALEAGPDTTQSGTYADWANASLLCPALPTPTPTATPTAAPSPTPTPTPTPRWGLFLPLAMK